MEASASVGEGDDKTKRNVYQIGGIPVDFPHKAYVTHRYRKTLSLLCSTLAWQKSYLSRYSAPPPSPPKRSVGKDAQAHPAPEGPDPFVDGGGFIPDTESSRENLSPLIFAKSIPILGNNGENQEHAPPRIYYASRTHTQISQVISEYRRTSYRVPMAILESIPSFSCVSGLLMVPRKILLVPVWLALLGRIVNKKLLKDEEMGCMEFKVKEHSSLKRGGCHEVHDIEDLVKIGRSVKGCSYFGARSLATEAQLVFCPYNYVINPIIRKAMEIDLKGDILILDEAHNIEDMARDAASVDIDEDILHRLHHELGELCHGPTGDSATYQPLHDMVQKLRSTILGSVLECDFIICKLLHFNHLDVHASWTGGSAIKELADSGICLQSFPILEGCAKKAIKDYSEGGTRQVCLSGISATTLEGLFCSLSYLFSGNALHATDYQLVLQRYGKRDGNNVKSWAHTLNLWCLNPGIVFKEMADLSLSVILTSGKNVEKTSWYIESYHLIYIAFFMQLFAAGLSRGPGSHRLNASYKTSDGYAFQDELGSSLEEIFKAVPGGVLVFFPSYKFLEKLHSRWRQTGQWSQLNAQKPIFIEPRGNVDDFEVTLKAYFNSISGTDIIAHGKIKERQKRTLKRLYGMHRKDSAKRRGAALLAVCRGKASEGVNFSDDNARAVVSFMYLDASISTKISVIVGIPFPSINDLQVALKKKYNDTYRSSKSLLGGSEWYCHQAFRALNQAAGRCIRHRFDYGAVIFLDERLEEERNLAYISKWIGHSIKHFGSFHTVLDELRSFFLNAKNESHFFLKDEDNMPNASQKGVNEDEKWEEIPKPKQLCAQNERERDTVRLTTARTGHGDIPLLEGIQDAPENEAPLRLPATSLALSEDCLDLGVVVEDSAHYFGATMGLVSQDNKPHADVVQDHSKVIDQVSFASDSSSNEILLESSCSVTYLEERLHDGVRNSEVEASLSVNTRCHKRRMMTEFQLGNCTRSCSFDCAGEESRYILDDENTTTKPRDSKDRSLKLEHQEPLPLSSDPITEKKLHLCCSACRSSLGLSENSFLLCLSFVLKNGLTSTLSPESLLRTELTKVPVVIIDISSVDRRVLSRRIFGESLQPDIWSEEDGCVFRVIYCPFCITSATCLGLQIMATDASNAHLLNKVLLFDERLHIEPDLASKNEDSLPICHGKDPDFMEIERFAFAGPSKRGPAIRDTNKSKISLCFGMFIDAADCSLLTAVEITQERPSSLIRTRLITQPGGMASDLHSLIQ
ncbi:unnamed protein product [Spirodela intermedia]|uniref:Helicase ATP-binding domain-containing protein n=1 Tax=Spirodela intermedia TaxID=51605 RepID=A0A7I8IDL7_SPIIN|nr:unnamed protein product [Spirodela intermedia]CAA6655856.1 unnamed protein product [Spirodela intermedia]